MFNLRSLLATVAIAATALAGIALEANAQRSLWLYNGGSTTVEGYFNAGESIYGTCDGDCFDLDLFLYDANGNAIGSDTATDAFPIVTAPAEGYYTVEVTMPDCSHPQGCAVEVTSDFGF
ncbi:hypothetical protein [Synechococcus sp. PCC 7336]|uniref:hypothetical protein n=1 Tax=Synechococcus sp. PCC 7336 TaxID=195250 RepID=UPI0003498014|nr:hypothetical protein [Synechococcus sp. PCC 7336]